MRHRASPLPTTMIDERAIIVIGTHKGHPWVGNDHPMNFSSTTKLLNLMMVSPRTTFRGVPLASPMHTALVQCALVTMLHPRPWCLAQRLPHTHWTVLPSPPFRPPLKRPQTGLCAPQLLGSYRTMNMDNHSLTLRSCGPLPLHVTQPVSL
jgi:hypothetical protein